MEIRAVRTVGVYQTESLQASNILSVYITHWLFPFQYAVESDLVPLGKGLEKEKLFITGYFEFICRKFSGVLVPEFLLQLLCCFCPLFPLSVPDVP